MAGLKKSKKDASSPNTVLVVFLIFFVLVSIGLGVFAYYGYDAANTARNDAKNARNETKTYKELRNQEALGRYEATRAIGGDLTPEDLAQWKNLYTEFIQQPDMYKDVANSVKQVQNLNKFLGPFSEAEMKYPATYEAKIVAATKEAEDAKSQLKQKIDELAASNTRFTDLNNKFEKAISDAQDKINAGNKADLAAAQQTNSKFPALQKLLTEREAELKKQSDKFAADMADLGDQLARKTQEAKGLEKRLNDQGLGLTSAGGNAGPADVHALILDISRGLPLWDRPLGRIVRVEPANLLVYIDIGHLRGVRPELTFQVFAANNRGEADRKLKGTLEVVRVIDDNNSVCRITSLFDDEGQPITLASNDARMRALRESNNILKEGDLLFNTFFDSHIAIAGNINFLNYSADSPATQNLMVQEFAQILLKQRIYVDSYVNLLNGQIEGVPTPRTRVLVLGNIVAVNGTADEQGRLEKIKEASKTMRELAVKQGMFIISAENFAALIGYRPPQSLLSKDQPIGFRPLVPFVNNGMQRAPRLEAAPAPGEAPAPAMEKKDAEPKKDAEK
jgi:hypothetical protein